jgi:glycosyltransferase involved in cell wall biosynthesis
LLNFPAFFSPLWIHCIHKTVRQEQASLIIVRDLPLAPAAVFVGRITQTPVIMDMAENYPAMIKDTWDYRGPGRFDFIIRNPRLLRLLERWILPHLDGVITVSRASQSRIRSLAGEYDLPVWVIQNTPRLDTLVGSQSGELSERIRSMPDLKLLYVGGLEESRGLSVAIRALPLMLEKSLPVCIVIVGEGTARPGLEELAEELGVRDKIIFSGWLDPGLVPGVISEADICIVPHFVTEHTDTTLPNKIYDYMAQAKPVIVTHSRSLREIVEQNSCGRWYQDDSPEALAMVIGSMNDAATRRELGMRGQQAVQRELNWSVDAKALLEIVDGVAATKAIRRVPDEKG